MSVGKRQPLFGPLARAVNTEECESDPTVTGSGAKSPRNFLNVLAKCSNPPDTCTSRRGAALRGYILYPI